MPYWRGIFVVTLGLLTSGCLFSAFQIASLTASGVSYVFSGKGVGDHALSMALDKNCATLRILEGEAICLDNDPDYENASGVMTATSDVPELDEAYAVALASSDDAGTLIAEAETGIAGDDTAGETFSLLPANGPAPEAADTVQPASSAAIQVAHDAGVFLAGAAPEINAAPSLDFDAVIPETVGNGRAEIASVVRTPPALPVARVPDEAPVAVAAAASEPRVFLVLGSFRNSDNARKLLERHRAVSTAMMTLTSRGRNMYRVIAGPIGDGELARTRGHLAKAGIRNTWAVRLCQGNLTVPPCHETPVQQAQLPQR